LLPERSILQSNHEDKTPLIAARSILRRFGSFTALDSVDLAVHPGEIHALLGENGAGKSTLMNILSGLLRPTSGDILLNGKPVRFSSPTDAERQGIGMVHQHFLLVPPLSVKENLLLGASPKMGGALSYPIGKVLDEAQALATRLGWQIPWDAPAGNLPVGTQQRVEILKALRGITRVLIFDEPTAVLTPTETPELFDTIRRLAAEGCAILFISHKLDEVLALSQSITVLRRGKVVARLRTEETDAHSLAEAMVGRDSEAAALLSAATLPVETVETVETVNKVPEFSTGTGALTVKNLMLDKQRAESLSFTVKPGEILGIAGVDGNGQGELADCLTGLMRPWGGSVQIDGETPQTNPASFRRAGVAVIPADRQVRGLAMPMTLTENFALGVYDKSSFRWGPLLRWPSLRQRAETLIHDYDIRASGPSAAAQSLSGGNQQKVVIARALAGNPKVVVAVNPTRGLDVGAIAYVHRALRKARDAGAAIVLISTELEEILSLSTERVAVLYEGSFSGIVTPNTPRDEIGLLMGGKKQKEASNETAPAS
jgi:ABC-type uncharacterized transport system ATPase subunit